MNYFVEFESYKKVVGEGRSFVIMVSSNGVVYMSSQIPISVLDDIRDELEMVREGGVGITIWVHSGNGGKIITFVAGSIERIEIEIYP